MGAKKRPVLLRASSGRVVDPRLCFNSPMRDVIAEVNLSSFSFILSKLALISDVKEEKMLLSLLKSIGAETVVCEDMFL